MKKVTKSVVALAVGVMLLGTYSCQKEEGAQLSRGGACLEVSDSLQSVFAKTGIQFPSVVEGRLAFASDEALKNTKGHY